MRSQCVKLFDRFQSARQRGPVDYRWATHHDGGGDWHVVLCGNIHGNEVGSLPGLVELAEHIAIGTLCFPHKLTVMLGNPEAALANKRFLETDLNRCFLDRPEDTHETRRARELMPILSTADLLIDLHQTIRHTERPFYIFPRHPLSLSWAAKLGASDTYVDATPGPGPSATRCADEFVWMRDKPAITIELSEKGFTQSADEITKTVIRNLISTDIEHMQSSQPAIVLSTIHREPYGSSARRLRPGLSNFTPIDIGENLARVGSPDIIAQHSGYLLFPKYPPERSTGELIHPPPEHIYRIIA